MPCALSRRERETPHLLMETSEFNGDGDIEKEYQKSLFYERVVTDIWNIRRRRTNLEDKDCFYFISNFEQFREDLDMKQNSRLQNLASLDWTSVITGDHLFEGGGIVT